MPWDDESVRAHRWEMFVALGFTTEEAADLIEARGLDGFPLNHHDVRRYLDGGATREHILRIFSA